MGIPFLDLAELLFTFGECDSQLCCQVPQLVVDDSQISAFLHLFSELLHLAVELGFLGVQIELTLLHLHNCLLEAIGEQRGLFFASPGFST